MLRVLLLAVVFSALSGCVVNDFFWPMPSVCKHEPLCLNKQKAPKFP